MVLGVSYMTHKRTLVLLSQCMPLELSLEKRVLRFINRIQISGTGIVKAF